MTAWVLASLDALRPFSVGDENCRSHRVTSPIACADDLLFTLYFVRPMKLEGRIEQLTGKRKEADLSPLQAFEPSHGKTALSLQTGSDGSPALA